MARIKKFAGDIPQNLTSISTFLVDENPNSDYFRITEFKETFTGGKNGFLIEGSLYLKETTEVKIEILDVEGNTIYYEPGDGIPEYYEGISKVVSVYIYEDTPIGLGKITILGEAKQYLDTGDVVRDIPEEWKGLYNVKWEREFNINKNLTNEDKVRFYRRPEVSITEIARPIFTSNPVTITQSGTVTGTPIVPSAGTNLTQFPRPSQYLLTTLDNTRWTGSVVNSSIIIDGSVVLSPQEVVSDTELIVSTPYTENNIVVGFDNKSYSTTFSYLPVEEGLGTALSGSFGKFVITNLETFVGDVARVKVFRKSQADLADFQFVQEFALESSEILLDYESSQREQENYGLFTPYILETYWVTSSNDITVEFNQSFLYNSAKLVSSTSDTFHTSQSLVLTNGVEYTLTFNAKIEEVVSGDLLEVYIQGTKDGVVRTQNIATINSGNTLLQKSRQEFNFISDDYDNDAELYFKVKGTWYIGNVSLRASQETSFSPDEITFLQSVPRTLPEETFDFRFEFYDINNNYIPVEVLATKTFNGGNLNLINKRIDIVPTSLYFQFDSGSQQGNAIPPKVIFLDVEKDFLTGSVSWTSASYDNENNLIDSSSYSSTFYPGLLEPVNVGVDEERYRLTVENFTGSIYDTVVQYVEYTATAEGVSSSVVITRVADGKGGVNFEIRPYRGTVIRNSDPTSSIEIQAIRIDGLNEVNLRDNLPLDYSVPLLYITSASLEGDISYITLFEASQSGYVRGLTAGTTGSGEINYNASFNRDAIDGQRTVYLIPSTSPTSQSILTSLTLTDLQDGLNTGEILFDVDSFTVNPYPSFQNSSLARTFSPTFSGVTGSFFRRGQTDSPISGTLDIYPSMSVSPDFIPEYWIYYETGAFNEDVEVVVRDENKNVIQPQNPAVEFDGSTRNQHKQLSVTFTYYEPFTTASVSIEKTFNIVPAGKAGDDAIVIEFNPRNVTLLADESRLVTDYTSTITEIRVKQGNSDENGYLQYRQERQPGTFYVDPSLVQATNISFDGFSSATEGETTIVTGEASDFTVSPDIKLAKIVFPIEIRPFFTSSYYTTSVSQSIQRQDASPAARGLTLTADTNTVTYNGDGNLTSPSGDITLTATAFNTTGSGNINFYFFKDDSFIDVVNQNSTTVTKAIPSSEFPAGGEIQTYRVHLHDGNSDIDATPNAIASTTITGIQDGVANYQAVVTNQSGFALYKVGGNLVFDNTSTTIEAYKGNEKLTHVSSYSFPTFDDLGNVIPNGEYQVTVHSFSAHLDLAGSLVSQSLLTTNVDGEAFIDVLDDWTDPIDSETLEPLNGTGTVVFRVDFEEGRDSVLVRQNLSVQYEGNVGPGLIMRGVWTGSLDYIFDVPAKRRDAVIYPGAINETYYWGALTSSINQPPPTLSGEPTEGTANDYWEYLGKEEFFVAAKLAIFEESFVKNTINVGNNAGSEFANIVLAGGRPDPYIAVGQRASDGVTPLVEGDPGDQTTTGVIGYNRSGIFLGTFEDNTPRFSLRSPDTEPLRYLRWDGENIEILGSNFSIDAAGNVVVRGSITVTGGNATTTSSLNAVSNSLIDLVEDTELSLQQFAEAVSLDASQSAVGIAEALTYALANGTLTGTSASFISENFIYSPVIAGQEGVFVGKISVDSGSMFLGKDVNGTNDGLYINSNNYWYNDGNFSVGGVGGSFTFDGASGSINLNNGTFLVDNKGNLFANSGSFRGTVNANIGSLGGWVISDESLTSENGVISLISTGSEQGIKVRNDSGIVKVNINSQTSLPQPGAGTNYSITGTTTATSSSVFGNYQSEQNTIIQQLGTFTVTSGNGGNYDISLTIDKGNSIYGGLASAVGNASTSDIGTLFILREGSYTGSIVGYFNLGYATAQGYNAIGEAIYVEQSIQPIPRTITTTATLDESTTYYLTSNDTLFLNTTILPSGISGDPAADAYFQWDYDLEANLTRVGTTLNDGGFQIVRGVDEFFRFNAETVPTNFLVGDINGSSTKQVRTDLSGSIGVDNIYTNANELPNTSFTGAGTSSPEGYVKLNNDLYLQFGYNYSAGDSTPTITFPLTFTRVYTAMVHTDRNNQGSNGANHIDVLGNSSMTVVTDNSEGRCWWMAVGIIV